MTFEEYQKLSRKTAVYPIVGEKFVYPALGLAGESGEVVEKIKKIVRNDKGKVTDEARSEIFKELGDVLWYISQLATELDLSLEEIATTNIKKLADRQQRGVLHSQGDNR